MLEELQKCSDFTKKDLIERAAVTTQMVNYGYTALFGVKYHAKLAHIERKRMMIKRAIRSKLDGSLPAVKRLIKDAWPNYTVHDARKSARHCRVTMRAYMKLGGTDLDELREEELKMKGHRRVFDSVTARFVLRAEMKLSAKGRVMALRTEKSRLGKLAKIQFDERNESEWKPRKKRKARYDVDDEVKIERDWASKVRKANRIVTRSLDGDSTAEKSLRWATLILEEFHATS